MQQRYYDPQVPRFLSVDPVAADARSGGNFNRYWYANNNPYKFTDPDGRYVETLLDIGFIAYDVYELATEPSWTSAAALGLDVAGAALPFVTGLGQAYRAANGLVDVAKTAEKGYSRTGKPAADGVQLHKQFDAAASSGAVRNVHGETSYLNGNHDGRYRPTGSSNPDAVLGDKSNPIATFDYKSGESGISNAQASKAVRNLPPGTPMYEIRSSGHSVPRPASQSGSGAAVNVACNAASNCE